MTPAELRALAAEVEALTGPSREMDVRIWSRGRRSGG